MAQKMYVALRCISCEKVSCCIIDGEVRHCDECESCKLLDDNYMFELQHWICGNCQEKGGGDGIDDSYLFSV